MKVRNRKESIKRKHLRLRQKISGTAARPRMAVSVSNRNMQVQFIDDDTGVTIAAASTIKGDAKNNVDAAKILGKAAADAAIKQGIKNIVVDRGGFKFHGRVKAVVDAAVESGLTLAGKEVK